jgi:hypothetical protein
MECVDMEECVEQTLQMIGRSRSFRGRLQMQQQQQQQQQESEADGTIVMLRNLDPSLSRGSIRGSKSALKVSTPSSSSASSSSASSSASGKSYALCFASVTERHEFVSSLTRARLDWVASQKNPSAAADDATAAATTTTAAAAAGGSSSSDAMDVDYDNVSMAGDAMSMYGDTCSLASMSLAQSPPPLQPQLHRSATTSLGGLHMSCV